MKIQKEKYIIDKMWYLRKYSEITKILHTS